MEKDINNQRVNPLRILVTGATGFIASQIVTDLMKAGHHVVCCARNTEYARNLFPDAEIIACDFVRDTQPEQWIPRLANIDVVINCVGIFYHPNKKIIWATHYDVPKALFDACVQTKIKKVIHLSALGIDKVNIDYASSKKAADDYLMSLPIASIILRPSLVYSRGSYGGTSLFRGLAGLPFIIPVPGNGRQLLQPIYLPELTKAIIHLISTQQEQKLILHAVGPRPFTLSEILTKLRAWLGFRKATVIHVPLIFMRIGAFFGNFIPYSAMNKTAYQMLRHDNISNDVESKKFFSCIGFTPSDYSSGLYTQPSTVQDHWHARLFFLKPLLQLSIAFIWIFSAICALFLYPKSNSYDLLSQMGIQKSWQDFIFYGANILDLLIGIAFLFNFQTIKNCILQIFLIIVYTLIITWYLPQFWLEPFAPIAKNIPLIVAILVYLAMESDR